MKYELVTLGVFLFCNAISSTAMFFAVFILFKNRDAAAYFAVVLFFGLLAIAVLLGGTVDELVAKLTPEKKEGANENTQ